MPGEHVLGLVAGHAGQRTGSATVHSQSEHFGSSWKQKLKRMKSCGRCRLLRRASLLRFMIGPQSFGSSNIRPSIELSPCLQAMSFANLALVAGD